MRRTIGALVVATLTTAALAGLPPAAEATGTGQPTITVPAQVTQGVQASIDLDFSDAPIGQYEALLDGAGLPSSPYAFDGSNPTVSDPVPDGLDVGEHRVAVSVVDPETAATTTVASAVFQVDAPPPPPEPTPPPLPALAISAAALPSPSTFYPRVRDGFRDSTSLRYSTNRRANVLLQVFRGRTALRNIRTSADAGVHRWTWSGGQDNGRYAAAGVYSMRITATSDGVRRIVKRPVRVATKLQTRHVTRASTGLNTSTRQRSSYCYISRDYIYDAALSLDCYGGRVARASYGFTAPARTVAYAWHVLGHTGCCEGGSVSHSARWTSARHLSVATRVTGWRQYSVRRVTVTFTYQVRI